jgi:tetratricopeptide (TPR) repeat protein
MEYFDDNINDDFGIPNKELKEKLELYWKDFRKASKKGERIFDLDTIENLTEYCLENEKFEEALDLSREWVKMMPDSIDAHNKLAFSLLNLDRSHDALKEIENAMLIDSDDSEAILLKATILESLGKIEESKEIIIRLLDSEPDNSDYQYAHANILQTAREYDPAIEIYLYLLESSDDYALQIYQDLAFCYNAIEEYDKALQYYDLAIQLNPFDANLWYNKGVIYSNLSDIKKAITAFDMSVTIDPEFFIAWFNLAHSYSTENRLEDSATAYKKALEIKPEDIDCLHNLASVFGDLCQYEKALELFEQIIDINPHLSSAVYGAGLCYEILNNYDSAMECFDRAISLNNKYFEVYISFSHLLLKLERNEEAIDLLKKAAKIAVNERVFNDFIAVNLFELNDVEGTLTFLNELLESTKHKKEAAKMISFYISIATAFKENQDKAREIFEIGYFTYSDDNFDWFLGDDIFNTMKKDYLDKNRAN